MSGGGELSINVHLGAELLLNLRALEDTTVSCVSLLLKDVDIHSKALLSEFAWGQSNTSPASLCPLRIGRERGKGRGGRGW